MYVPRLNLWCILNASALTDRLKKKHKNEIFWRIAEAVLRITFKRQHIRTQHQKWAIPYGNQTQDYNQSHWKMRKIKIASAWVGGGPRIVFSPFILIKSKILTRIAHQWKAHQKSLVMVCIRQRNKRCINAHKPFAFR